MEVFALAVHRIQEIANRLVFFGIIGQIEKIASALVVELPSFGVRQTVDATTEDVAARVCTLEVVAVFLGRIAVRLLRVVVGRRVTAAERGKHQS